MKWSLIACVALGCGHPALPPLTGSDGGNTDAGAPDASNVGPPRNLAYAFPLSLYTESIGVPANAPTADGAPITAYSVMPVLPAGLSLDPTTGVVSGTAAAQTMLADYTITASNPQGSTTAKLSIGVNANGVIAGGAIHSCARVGSAADCWGDNGDGQLGDGTQTQQTEPVAVSGLTSGVQAIYADGNAVNDTGDTCAIVGGAAKCWGDNGLGQLGNNTTGGGLSPVQVTGLTSGVQMISVGGIMSCALVNRGVQCWGGGALGNGTSTESNVPVQVTGLGSGVQAVSAGEDHACALLDSGGIMCWGDNFYGELGNTLANMANTPVEVAGLTSDVQAVSAGGFMTCVIVHGGVKCWGVGTNGQLGNGVEANSVTPVDVTGLDSGVQAISCGIQMSCALLATGAVKCWGLTQFGQFDVPTQVANLTTGVQAISVGNTHACAVVNGTSKCWGGNNNGQLGDDSTTGSASPVTVFVIGPVVP